jgi:hypothetical protein
MGFMVISCEEKITDGKAIIGNNTNDYTITQIKLWGEGGTDIKETVSLTKGQSKQWTLPIGSYKFTIEYDYHGEYSDLPLNQDAILDKQFSLRDVFDHQEEHPFFLTEKRINEDSLIEKKGRTLWFSNNKDSEDIVY